MSPNKENVLDPTKELPIDESVNLEGMPLTAGLSEQLENLENESYDQATPIKMYPVRKQTTDLIAYRKKRNKKNKAAKKSRMNNRKKK
jgi:hypothetical protein